GVRLGDIARDAEGKLLGRGLVAELLLGEAIVELVGASLLLDGRVDHHEGVAMLGGEGDGLQATGSGKPDRGMRLLERARPGIDVAILVMLAHERERSRL